MFQNTKVPLQKWFLAISLIMSAKKGMSSLQLSRHIGVGQAAWSMAHKIREQIEKQDNVLLQGIVEADETYTNGKPRRCRDAEGNLAPKSKPGHGTNKIYCAVVFTVLYHRTTSSNV
jgi:hypothetical protein